MGADKMKQYEITLRSGNQAILEILKVEKGYIPHVWINLKVNDEYLYVNERATVGFSIEEMKTSGVVLILSGNKMIDITKYQSIINYIYVESGGGVDSTLRGAQDLYY